MPQNLAWMDEWGSFFVDLWLSHPAGGGVGVAGGSLTLTYNTDYFSVDTGNVTYGPAFDVGRATDVNEPLGRVTLRASTLVTHLGEGKPTLFASVRFAPASSDSGVPLNSHGQYILPVADWGLAVENGVVDLAGVVAGPPEVGPVPQTELWPVMYDLEDDGRVDFSDFAYFASAFQHLVGDPGATYAYASDFDRSGKVDFSDFAFFAANFQRRASDATPLAYPADFPAAWRPGGDPLRLELPDAQRSRIRQTSDNGSAEAGTPLISVTQYEPVSPLSEAQLAPVVQTAIARSVAAQGGAATASLNQVTFQIVDLPGSLLGREVGGGLVQIDVDAAGYGWFVDTTPWDDVEFAPGNQGNELLAAPGSPALHRVDLLTVIFHELGHVLGHDHEDQGIMDDTLPLGTRRLPSELLSESAPDPFDPLDDSEFLLEPTATDADTVDKVFAGSEIRHPYSQAEFRNHLPRHMRER